MNQDSLPEKTIIKLEAAPRWEGGAPKEREGNALGPLDPTGLARGQKELGAGARQGHTPRSDRRTCRFVVVFNPLEQERLSVVTLLVNTARVRVLDEEGQPLAVQLSAQWSSATDMAPDVYQVAWGKWGEQGGSA